MEFFGTGWDELELEHVRDFLAAAGDEGLTWEAKGTVRPRPDAVVKHCCGFANALGGFLIIGAHADKGSWHLDGVDFSDDEPRLWIGNIIRSGLSPVPWHDVHAWEVARGRTVAIVRVDAVAGGPCMSASGEIFERVSGATIRVQDPASLRALFASGNAAIERAEAEALRALGDPPSPSDDARFALALALAPTGKPADVSMRLFTEAFEGAMVDVFESLPASPLYAENHANRFHERAVRQDSVTMYAHQGLERWTARVGWDASAQVLLTVVPDDPGETTLTADAIFADAVRPAAGAATSLVALVGGHGQAHVALRLSASKFKVRHAGRSRSIPISSGITVRTWTDAECRLDEAAIERMKREVLRAVGIPAYEPAA